MTTPVTRVERDSILWEVTRSLCPECRKVIDAQIHLRGGKVIMRKRCPEHGPFEAVVFGDSDLYTRILGHNQPGTMRSDFRPSQDGCPLDCGLRPEHRSTPPAADRGQLGVQSRLPGVLRRLGVHSARAHRVPVTYEQVEGMLDTFVAAEGEPEVIQSQRRADAAPAALLDFIGVAQRKGISYVMVNTNGIRIRAGRPAAGGDRSTAAAQLPAIRRIRQRTNTLLRGRGDS